MVYDTLGRIFTNKVTFIIIQLSVIDPRMMGGHSFHEHAWRIHFRMNLQKLAKISMDQETRQMQFAVLWYQYINSQKLILKIRQKNNRNRLIVLIFNKVPTLANC